MTLHHWRMNLSLTVLMIACTGSDHTLECPIQKPIVLLLICLLLESHPVCWRALDFLLCCGCSGNVGNFLVTGPVCCCGQVVSVGRFLFVSIVVVMSDSLFHTPEGMALKHALAWMPSAMRHFSCWFGLRHTSNCRSPLVAHTSSVSRLKKKSCFNWHFGVILCWWHFSSWPV